MGTMIRAEILGPAGEVLTTTVHPAPLVIGSSASAGLRLQGEGVGEEQLEVSLSPSGGLRLRQLDEGHLTMVGALHLSEAETPGSVSLRVGEVDLRITRTDKPHIETKEPEATGASRIRAWSVYAASIALIGWQSYLLDYTDSPGEETAYLVIGIVFFTLVWAGLWAVGNRVFRYPLAFARHLQITAVFLVAGTCMSSIEGALQAAFRVDGLGTFLNWTVWALWWVAFMGSHMMVAGGWSRRRVVVVAAATYYGLFALFTLIPGETTPVEQVKRSLEPPGYLPKGLYWASDPGTLREDAADLAAKARELPVEEDVGGR